MEEILRRAKNDPLEYKSRALACGTGAQRQQFALYARAG
jgi:hypothetical protein